MGQVTFPRMEVGPDPYAAPMRQWSSEQLFKARDDVQALLDSPGWAVVDLLLRASKLNAQMRLTRGPIDSHPRLARDIGLVHGMDEAVRAAHSVLAQADRTERKLDQQAQRAERREG